MYVCYNIYSVSDGQADTNVSVHTGETEYEDEGEEEKQDEEYGTHTKITYGTPQSILTCTT